MKNRFTIGLLAVGLFSFTALAGCGKKPGGDTPAVVEFSFVASLSNGAKTLNKGEEAHIVIDETGGEEGVTREYTYTSSDPAVAAVSTTGTVTAVDKGSARIVVKEKVSEKQQVLQLTITDATPASGGFNYASLAGDTAIAKRTEILGQLEKYTMDNHLTGITLFENGGYVKYSERVELPTTNYITGYGFGLLSEGRVNGDMAKEENPAYKQYLHSASSSDPKVINARNDTGSQVSDLEGYITSSFWGTKMNSTKTGYEWYPLLAKDTIKYGDASAAAQAFDRPVPVYQDQIVKPNEDPNPLGLYNTWRIYVKTGAQGVKYRYNGTSWGTNFDGRDVELADYEFAYRLLLTGANNLIRGTEMAGDQTYGIVGAQKYNLNTKNATDQQAKDIWDNMKSNNSLGIKTGTDPVDGDYIQLTILNPIDRFTAMYTLSSSLLSPLPEAFISTIGAKYVKDNSEHDSENPIKEGAQRYGTFNNNSTTPSAHKDKILDFVLSVGPYMLQEWVKNQAIVFGKNDQWIETDRYFIKGVKIKVVEAATQSTTAIYDLFNSGELDSCGIPTKYISKEVGQPRVYKTRGDSTFKLNVNSCDQDTWNNMFGPQGTINKNSSWDLKPWMSNDNFLNGLFYAIDRKTFASNRGVQPSINYFSDAYLNDPENGLSYNDSEAHQKAVEAYQTYDSKGESTYGYSKDRAILAFKAAVKELVAKGKIQYGTKDKPYEIHIHIRWMYQTDIKEYGEEIGKYFTDAFNDNRVSEGRVKLVVDQEAVKNWSDVYYEYLMKGQFDLGFGAISGNTYNPLNFLEVLKSNNSSGFTLNWGTDTSKITKAKPLIYEDKMWSFDALWAVADHGGVVDNGENAKIVNKSYMISDKNAFYEGANFSVATEFIQVEAAKLDVSRVQIYIAGSGGIDLTPTAKVTADGKVMWSFTLSAAQADEINKEIQRVNKLDDPSKQNYDPHPFTVENYGKYWSIDVSYTLAIKPEGSTEYGTPTESYVSAAKNENSWIDNQEVFV